MEILAKIQEKFDGELDVLTTLLPKNNTLKIDERTALYDRMKRLVMGGKEYYSALSIIRDLSSQRKMNNSLRRRIAVYDRAILRMRESNVGLGEAFEGAIPESEKNLITAAESGENITVGLDSAMMISRLNSDIKRDVIMAVTYPLIIFSVIIGGIAFFGQSLLPQFASFMPVEQWEPLGRNLYYISTTVQYWAPAIAAIAVGLGIAFVYSLPKWVGKVRESVDDLIPFYEISKTIQSSILLISLSAYLRSGIPFVNALRKINNETESLWVKRHIEEITENTRNKGSIGDSMVVSLFDEDSREDIAIYSRSSNDEFSIALAEIGEAGVKRALERINKLAAKVKFFLTLIGGATILSIYVSVLSVGNNIQSAM